MKIAGGFLRQLAFALLTYPNHTLRCSKLRFLEILALFILSLRALLNIRNHILISYIAIIYACYT
ncbi:MAG: hypothetical protein WBV93_10090, partial [Anaerobacillus sp.]